MIFAQYAQYMCYSIFIDIIFSHENSAGLSIVQYFFFCLDNSYCLIVSLLKISVLWTHSHTVSSEIHSSVEHRKRKVGKNSHETKFGKLCSTNFPLLEILVKTVTILTKDFQKFPKDLRFDRFDAFFNFFFN